MAVDQELEVYDVQNDPEGDEPEEDEEAPAEDGGDEGDDDEEEEEEEEEEEDLVDPGETLKEKCANTSECQRLKEKFEQCEERVNSRTRTEESCAEELLDFLHCQDSCVAKSIFSHLK